MTPEKLLKNAKRITRCNNKQEADMLEELLTIFDHEARTVEASREQIMRLTREHGVDNQAVLEWATQAIKSRSDKLAEICEVRARLRGHLAMYAAGGNVK